MKKIIILIATLTTAFVASGQNTLEVLLNNIEQNNPTLRAERYAVEGRKYESRMDNSLGPLSVMYNSVPESASELGKVGELEVTQTIDLPMLYVSRSRVARELAQQYDAEYMQLRQEILLSAEELYIELCTLERIQKLNDERLKAAKHITELFAERYSTGDVTLVEKNRAEFETLLLQDEFSANSLRIIELKSQLKLLNGGELPFGQFEMPILAPLPALDQLLYDWEQNAPQIAIMRSQKNVAAEQTRLSRRAALPSLALGYKHEYGDGEFYSGFIAGLNIPIFSNRNNVKRAKAEEYAAAVASESAAHEVRTSVTELYDKLLYLETMLQSSDEFPNAEEYTSVMRDILDSGQIDITTYYSELNIFYSALEARFRIEMNYLIGFAQLNVIYI